MDIALLILWGITGVLNLASVELSRRSYALMWICLMLVLASNAFGGKL